MSLSPRLLELHSPDGQHTVVLRCKDGPSANSWFTAIHTNIAALLPQTLAHINAYLGASSSTSTHPHLKHIGWLAEQVFSAMMSFYDVQYMIVTHSVLNSQLSFSLLS